MKEHLFEYLLRLGDDSLILGHRLSEWCGHGPILEEDIAMTNISLDLIGQATSLLKYAGELEGKGRDEDKLAFLRIEKEYKNCLLVEQPNGDFGVTMMRQFLFDAYRLPFFEALQHSKDEQLSGIAEKSLKETKYHYRHSAEWIIRLGDGTEESHQRVQTAMNTIYRYAADIFMADEVEKALEVAGILPNMAEVKEAWLKNVKSVIAEATIKFPDNDWEQLGGRLGNHSEHLGFLLAEMQYMQRTYPNMEW
ncbi:MAG: phenylacetate-CoA oxygenase subunit PaaC [Crocinitomicaceae bacterium]|nr:phenylacetate-CoA oxygenase subunit PaaC [Crocinitomicaceae bacterium]MDG2464915.1 phenylacetate-CoA oxygenase subunit PaaC [Crocinitomicaceae bacterium]